VPRPAGHARQVEHRDDRLVDAEQIPETEAHAAPGSGRDAGESLGARLALTAD
jgi:hypothetical protein